MSIRNAHALLRGRMYAYDGLAVTFETDEWFVKYCTLHARNNSIGSTNRLNALIERYRGPFIHCELEFHCVHAYSGVNASWTFQVSDNTPVVPIYDKLHPSSVWVSLPVSVSPSVVAEAFVTAESLIGTAFNDNIITTHLLGTCAASRIALSCCTCQPRNVTCSELVVLCFEDDIIFDGIDARLSYPSQLMDRIANG
jgi:hypothetical protein